MKENILFASLLYFINEVKENKNRIMAQSRYQMRQQTLRTSLGMGWIFIRDSIYFAVFVIFRYLVAGNGDLGGMNAILFIILGMIPWNIMNQCINGSVKSIKNNKNILVSIKMSVIIIPIIDVTASFLNRAFTLLIMLGVVIYFGDIRNITWWMLVYYYFSMYILMIVWTQIFSSLIAISNDFEHLYTSIVSVLMYTLPIVWSFEIVKYSPWIIRLFKLNPIVYIVEGFRSACHTGIMPSIEYTLYFWTFNLILFCIGAVLQYKLRRHYVDLI